MDSISALLTMFGTTALLASWVYLIIVSFKTDYAWGFMSVFLPPLSYLYSLFNLGKTWESLLLAVVGVALLIGAL